MHIFMDELTISKKNNDCLLPIFFLRKVEISSNLPAEMERLFPTYEMLDLHELSLELIIIRK
jgi:hypothetical protein